MSKNEAYRLACSLWKIIGAPLWEKNIVEGQVCDGCSYKLQIIYADKRKKLITGDFAGDTFDYILEKFVCGVFLVKPQNELLTTEHMFDIMVPGSLPEVNNVKQR